MTLELSRGEVQILLQSLSNCIATCKTHAARASAKCPDCDSARAVQAKLRKAGTARPTPRTRAKAKA